MKNPVKEQAKTNSATDEFRNRVPVGPLRQGFVAARMTTDEIIPPGQVATDMTAANPPRNKKAFKNPAKR